MKIVAVTSGKGGSGKSTFSVQLSIAFEKLGKRVLLIDMDEGMRCLDMLLGASESLIFDLSDAIAGKELELCLLEVRKHNNIMLLAAPSSKGLFEYSDFGQFIRGLDPQKYDTVIIDLPAGLDAELYKALPVDTEFVCICNPNQVSVRDAANVGELLNNIGRRGRLVINRFEKYFVKNILFDNIDDIINETKLGLLGIVPESEGLRYAFCTGKFLTRGTDFKAFLRIASRLCGKDVKLPKLKKI
ncbi:MAG: AAA family ATPase [Clostridia bacterium]|nr:AAA family ATPase [Clostridia bacterium]